MQTLLKQTATGLRHLRNRLLIIDETFLAIHYAMLEINLFSVNNSLNVLAFEYVALSNPAPNPAG